MAGSFIEADLAGLFDVDEFAVLATWHNPVGDAVETAVIFDAPGALVLDDVITSDYSVTFRVSVWDGVRPGDEIDVGATSYRVQQVLPQSDGALAVATLSRLD